MLAMVGHVVSLTITFSSTVVGKKALQICKK